MPFPFDTVLVTGATSGIGRALAERMIEHSVFVIAAGRRKDRLDDLVEKHGKDKVAAEVIDLSDLAALPAWTERLTKTYPSLSAICLNAGLQRGLDFTSSTSSSPETLSQTTQEVTVNYLSPLHTTLLLLPHLRARSAQGLPAAVILVSSGLALVPIPRCPNYCASKAALHSLAWQLRTQLKEEETKAASGDKDTTVVRVIEIIPPAVQTELHTQQGLSQIGIPLQDFLEETWSALERGHEDEILVGPVKHHADVEGQKRQAYTQLLGMMRSSGNTS